MACMCGDLCCASCGPAQGNWKCPICRGWASEGCDHLVEDIEGTIAIRPEYQAEAEKIAQDEAAADAQYAADIEAEEKLIEAWQSQKVEEELDRMVDDIARGFRKSEEE